MHCVRGTSMLHIQIVWTIGTPKHEEVRIENIQKYYCTLIPEPLGKAHLVDGMQKHQSAADLGEVTISLVYRVSQKECLLAEQKKNTVYFPNFSRFWNITSETGETHHFMFLCFQPLPNLNTEVWQGARTLRSRCSPEETRKASSSPRLLCPSKNIRHSYVY